MRKEPGPRIADRGVCRKDAQWTLCTSERTFLQQSARRRDVMWRAPRNPLIRIELCRPCRALMRGTDKAVKSPPGRADAEMVAFRSAHVFCARWRSAELSVRYARLLASKELL